MGNGSFFSADMNETSEQTACTMTRDCKPDRQRDINLIPAEQEAINTAKGLAKKTSRIGKMSYVMKLITNVNKQMSDNCEWRQVDFNLQSLKKAIASFQDFNDEYVANLEVSDEIDRALKTLLGTEDNFQKCIAIAESYLADCRRETSSIRSFRKSGKYSMSSSSTRSDRHKSQDSMRRERIQKGASECSAEVGPEKRRSCIVL